MRIANKTNEDLAISAATNRRFGKPYITLAEVMEELLDRRVAMGYTDPEPEPESTPDAEPTDRKTQIEQFLDRFGKPTQEEPDATS